MRLKMRGLMSPTSKQWVHENLEWLALTGPTWLLPLLTEAVLRLRKERKWINEKWSWLWWHSVCSNIWHMRSILNLYISILIYILNQLIEHLRVVSPKWWTSIHINRESNPPTTCLRDQSCLPLGPHPLGNVTSV